MARDNFKKEIIKQLSLRADHTCSNPDCHIVTQGPSEKTIGVTSIGVAAHICAASPGGPRYNESMTLEERTSYSNGIWLCSSCSIKIDREHETHTVKLLNSWKLQAESNAKRQLGKKRFSDKEVTSQVSSILMGVPLSKSLSTIANAHGALSLSLESIDPRFSIKTYQDELGSHVNLSAKENIPCSFKIRGTKEDDLISKVSNFLHHGASVEIPSQSIEIEGSPLIQHIKNDSSVVDGKFIFEREERKISLRWYLINPQDGEIVDLENIEGIVFGGSKSTTAEFKGYGNALTLTAKITNDNNKLDVKHSINVNIESWEGKDLRSLSNLPLIQDIFSKILSGWSIKINAIVNEEYSELSRIYLEKNQESMREMFNFLQFTNNARSLALKTNQKIQFLTDATITTSDARSLINALEWIARAEKKEYIAKDGDKVHTKVVIENISTLKQMSKKIVAPNCVTQAYSPV